MLSVGRRLKLDALDLVGRKVRLRSFTEADITDVYIGWLNDPVVTRYSDQRFLRHDRESCVRYLASFDGTPNLFVSVRRLEDDRAIGTMTAYVSPHHGVADVGILIGDRSVWRGGFGQDAWDTFTSWLLSRPDIRKLAAGTTAVNQAMIRLAERSGMAMEGRRMRQVVIEGEAVDILYFGRFKDTR